MARSVKLIAALEKLSANANMIAKLILYSVKLGADPTMVSWATGLEVVTSGPDGQYEVLGLEDEPGDTRAPFDIRAARQEHRNYVSFFEESVEELNAMATEGLRGDGADEAILSEVLAILRYGFIGLCSRMFWNQFNPQCDDDEGASSMSYLTLEERIESFARTQRAVREVPESVGIRSEAEMTASPWPSSTTGLLPHLFGFKALLDGKIARIRVIDSDCVSAIPSFKANVETKAA